MNDVVEDKEGQEPETPEQKAMSDELKRMAKNIEGGVQSEEKPEIKQEEEEFDYDAERTGVETRYQKRMNDIAALENEAFFATGRSVEIYAKYNIEHPTPQEKRFMELAKEIRAKEAEVAKDRADELEKLAQKLKQQREGKLAEI